MEELYLASTWRRLGAFGIDFLLGGALALGIWFVLKDSPQLGPLAGAFVFYSYFVLSYRFMSRTPGKWFLGLYVVGYDGRRRLGWTRCLIRGLVQILSPLLSLFPQILALIREDRKQLADLLAGTQVMQKKPRMRPARIRMKLALAWGLIFLSLTFYFIHRFLTHA